MPIFQSGSPTNGGVALPSVPVNPGTFTKTLRVVGQTYAASAIAGSYQESSLTRPIWTADAPAQVVAVLERHSVIGSTSGQLVKAAGSTPLGSGANLLSAAISQVSTVDITQSGTLLNSTSLQQLAKGDQLGWRWSVPGALPPTGDVEVVLEYI